MIVFGQSSESWFEMVETISFDLVSMKQALKLDSFRSPN